MIAKTLEKPTPVVGPFSEEYFKSLTASADSTVLDKKRQEGFESYLEQATPTVRDEEWRRTDPALFPFDRVTPLPELQPESDLKEWVWDEDFDVVVSIHDRGFSIKDRTGLLKSKDVKVLSLQEAARTCPEVLDEYMQTKALPPSAGKFSALNAAFWNVGFLIHVADKVKLDGGILLRYELTESAKVIVPRLLVVIGNQSKAAVAEYFESRDQAEILSVCAKEFYIGEAATLKFITLQQWGDNTSQITSDHAIVQRDGCVDWVTLNLGGKLSKLKFGSDVAGPGSSAELDGLFFAAKHQHLDQTTLQIHSSPDTYSRLLYKGAVKDKGHSVYQGIIQAKRGAIRVDAYQTNNNLVLNDGARADTIPGLLIDADDLKCSHGATIGNLDEEQLFYLRSRGLDEAASRKILIMGFFEEIVDRVPYAFMRDRIHQDIEEKIGTVE